ncbi:OmpA family protein [Pontibacter cellulosilyticus]|uniref:OmpA family protein n=1 Tax=Pontibacter cellulosilyticus TaxID=1720253 RepID=A0A923SLJ6_9BACT|nr:OmpA family protein [Pontibacter cellulosilyticus]MBC5991225.1 OmpA family protein [Pontibacter cellulosilyticus]
MRIILLSLLFLNILVPAVAQNLVKNPSLEIYKDGVVGFRRISGTPDVASKYDKVIQYPPYYNSYQADLPTRSVSSVRFGDICLCQWFSETSSELTQVQLRKPLKKNKEYLVSLYTIKASVREPAISEVPVYFTKKKLPSTSKVYGFEEHELTGQQIPYVSLTSARSPVLDSMEDWVKVSAVYRAKGGERYLTIGNFLGANQEALEAMNPEGWEEIKRYIVQGTYYCYDNISVIPLSEAVPEEGEITKPTNVESPFAADRIITLSDVNFLTGSHDILPVAFPTLDALADFMATESEVTVHIMGHTDDVGSEEDNLRLSVRRAKAVKQYLESNGVAADRVTYTGFGENEPKVLNSTDENRARNRRVEIQIRQK